MNNFVETFVALTVATLKADGKTKKVETGCIQILAEMMGLDTDMIDQMVDSAKKQDSDIISLARSAADFSPDEKIKLLEACASVAISDDVLVQSEVELILSIGDALGLPIVKTVMTLMSVAATNHDVKVEITTRSGDDEFTEVFD